MTTFVFSNWFQMFCDNVTEHPLLLIFDGHMTHLSIDIIQRATRDQIFIIKLTPHTTDLFRTIKTTINSKTLNDLITSRSMTKSQSVILLSEIWRQGLSESNIKSGFSATHVYPVNSSKYNYLG